MSLTHTSLIEKPRSTAIVSRHDRQIIILIILSIVIYAIFKNGYIVSDRLSPAYLAAFFFIPAFISIAFYQTTYAGTSDAYRILARSVAAIMAFYAATSVHHLTGFEPPVWVVAALYAMQVCAVASGILAWWRPSFVAIPGIYVLVSKDWTEWLLGLPMLTRTDYLPVSEICIFLAVGIAAHRLMMRWHESAPPLRRYTMILFIMAVGIHFGNYFYSGLTKLTLDGGPLIWLLENQTQFLIPVTLETGMLPIGEWTDLVWLSYHWYGYIFVVANLIILLGQLYCAIAIMNVRAAALITVFYDITHVVIFIVSGILFWKWILMNLAIVAAFTSLRHQRFDGFVRLVGVVAVIGGTLVFFAARLAWYDTPALNNAYFVAITDDGREYEVPSNFFLAASVTVAQGRMGIVGNDHFPTGTWGTTIDRDVMKAAYAGCDFESVDQKPHTAIDFAALDRFVRAHHRTALDLADEQGRVEYDLYPHHVWSNPWLYTEFRALDKRRVVSYRYVVESVCVGMEDGALTRHVMAKREHAIDVR